MSSSLNDPRRLARMRLLFIIDSLGSGGAQRQMVTLARSLAARGHEPVFFIYHPTYRHFAGDLAEAGVTVVHVNKQRRLSLTPALELRRLARRHHFHAAVAYLPTPSAYAELASLSRSFPPLVVSERSAFSAQGPDALARLRMQFHRLADVVVINSHHQREFIEQRFPWLATRTRTIWNGVDLDRFAPVSGSRRAHAEDLLAVGTIRQSKNLVRLARALVLLAASERAVPKVRWVGKLTSDRASHDERAAVEAVLASGGIADRWEWLGERSDVPDLLRDHGALVHPSLLEGLPNGICEALASGTPVLAGAIGDHARLIEDGVTGILFDPLSPPSMADSITRFTRLSMAKRDVMGGAARQFAEQALSAARFCDEYEALLSSLAGTRSPIEPHLYHPVGLEASS